jgi:hypothetical protein
MEDTMKKDNRTGKQVKTLTGEPHAPNYNSLALAFFRYIFIRLLTL